MGLDMYLNRKVCIANYTFDPEGQKLACSVLDALGVRGDAQAAYQSGTIEISLPAAYWRKANAIHGWFVNAVQGGNDNCGTYYVAREQLKELRDLCEGVLNGTAAKEKLPPTAGFFFGDVDNDDYYREDLTETIKKIDEILATPDVGKHDYFEYRSSW